MTGIQRHHSPRYAPSTPVASPTQASPLFGGVKDKPAANTASASTDGKTQTNSLMAWLQKLGDWTGLTKIFQVLRDGFYSLIGHKPSTSEQSGPPSTTASQTEGVEKPIASASSGSQTEEPEKPSDQVADDVAPQTAPVQAPLKTDTKPTPESVGKATRDAAIRLMKRHNSTELNQSLKSLNWEGISENFDGIINYTHHVAYGIWGGRAAIGLAQEPLVASMKHPKLIELTNNFFNWLSTNPVGPRKDPGVKKVLPRPSTETLEDTATRIGQAVTTYVKSHPNTLSYDWPGMLEDATAAVLPLRKGKLATIYNWIPGKGVLMQDKQLRAMLDRFFSA